MWLWSGHYLLAFLLAFNILSQRSVSAEGEPCYKAANNSPGTCLSMRNCIPYLNLLREQGTKVGAFLRSTVCYYDGNNPVVCCPPFNNQVQRPPVVTEPPYRPSPPQQQPQNSAYGQGLDYDTCGISNAQHNRVVGGVPAVLGAWPWLTALGYMNKKDFRKPNWLCGGSLISSQHILTAGHCVYNRTDLYLARLGEHDIRSDNDGASPIDVRIVLGIIHPGYSAVNYVNDIAVLKLKNPVTFSPAIHPICLPKPETRFKNYTSNFPFIAGWGSLYFKGPSSTVLQEVQVPVVSQERCYDAFAPFKTQVIDERVLCAGFREGGRDACQGDSGGPLMTPLGNDQYSVIGIVSFGYKCGEPNIPGVYTKVSYFLDFINKSLQL